MTPQQTADLVLAQWQALDRKLSPDEKMEMLLRNFFQPSIDRYQDQLDIVAKEMERA